MNSQFIDMLSTTGEDVIVKALSENKAATTEEAQRDLDLN